MILWLTPAQVDPADPNAGDFLDFDQSTYLSSAAQAYEEGNYNLAIRYYLAALSRNIDDEISIYNVACCYALMDSVELSALYLQRAFIAGYRDLDYVREDPDFDGVRNDPYFQGAIQHIATAIHEPPEYSGQRLMVDGEAAFPCLVRLPDDFRADGEYTLVVALHGYGDSPENFVHIWERFQDPDFILACPRAPYPFMENNLTGYSWFLPYDADSDIISLDRISSDYVMSVVDALKERYNVRNVFLLGFSQGCALTWLTGIYYPQEFDGLIGLGGRLDTSYVDLGQAGDLQGMHAFVANGTMDQSVDFQEGLKAADILDSLGMVTEFHSWEGVHGVSSPILRQVQQWMKTIED
jgi:phospholipase/carboxylesterase